MGFCNFSQDLAQEGYTAVDNIFLSSELPNASSDAVKVYLYGLYICKNPTHPDGQSLKLFASRLYLDEEVVFDCFLYWERRGVIRLKSTNPLSVEFLSLHPSKRLPKKYEKSKYADFNLHAQDLFVHRQITPTEYTQYYELLEDTGLTAEALLMIMQFCIEQKDTNVGYQYILTVANSWVHEGVRTVADVDEKLKNYEASNINMKEVFSALGRKSAPSFNDFQTYLKWTDSWGFSHETILYCASLAKKGGMNQLDYLLDDFFNKSLFTKEKIEDYQTRTKELRNLTKNIAKRLSLFVEFPDFIIESYILPWLGKGFSDSQLLFIAQECLKKKYPLI